MHNNEDVNISAETERDDGERSPSHLPVPPPVVAELATLEESLRAIAHQYEGDTLALLALLRSIESVHSHIRDTLFQASLPNNRQRLYALLKDIEVEGGWPYIPRMKLQRLLEHFLEEEAEINQSGKG